VRQLKTEVMSSDKCSSDQMISVTGHGANHVAGTDKAESALSVEINWEHANVNTGVARRLDQPDAVVSSAPEIQEHPCWNPVEVHGVAAARPVLVGIGESSSIGAVPCASVVPPSWLPSHMESPHVAICEQTRPSIDVATIASVASAGLLDSVILMTVERGLLSYLDPFTQPNTAEETAAETWPQVSFAKIRVGSNPNHFPFKLDNNHGGKDKFIKGINSLGDDWGKTQIPALNDDSIVRLLRSQVLHYEMALRDG
jgi:hypothetical protein